MIELVGVIVVDHCFSGWQETYSERWQISGRTGTIVVIAAAVAATVGKIIATAV